MARFVPLYEEIFGYLKTFFYCWIAWFIIFIILTGFSWWGVYAGIGLGFLFAIISTAILNWWSGGGGFNFQLPKQKGDINVGKDKNYDGNWIQGGRNLW